MKNCQLLWFFFPKKYGLQGTEWLWSTDMWCLLPSNSWKKNEKMSETSLLKWFSFPHSVSIQTGCPQVTDIAQAHWFSCCYYCCTKLKKGLKRLEKLKQAEIIIIFFNLVMEISFLTTSLQSKEDFDGFCSYFRWPSISCSPFMKIRQDFNFYALEEKNYWNVSHGCWGNNISVAAAVPRGGDLVDVHRFLLVQCWFIWPKTQTQTLASKCCLE